VPLEREGAAGAARQVDLALPAAAEELLHLQRHARAGGADLLPGFKDLVHGSPCRLLLPDLVVLARDLALAGDLEGALVVALDLTVLDGAGAAGVDGHAGGTVVVDAAAAHHGVAAGGDLDAGGAVLVQLALLDEAQAAVLHLHATELLV